ncbi:RHS repeat-associated core domain-containing protein [Streptomyces sp. INA 01156]
MARSSTEYDAQGRVIKQGPGHLGLRRRNPGQHLLVGHRRRCLRRPEQADLLCTSGPAGDITGGGADPGPGRPRSGWFGTDQRSGDTLTGIVLMGARLYDPSTARFPQTDPVFGGNCNAYDFVCAGPVNGPDLDGRCGAWENPFKACDKRSTCTTAPPRRPTGNRWV